MGVGCFKYLEQEATFWIMRVRILSAQRANAKLPHLPLEGDPVPRRRVGSSLAQPNQGTEFVSRLCAPCLLIFSKVEGLRPVGVARLHLDVAGPRSILIAYEDVVVREVFRQERIGNA